MNTKPWINGKYMTTLDVKRFAQFAPNADAERCERALAGEQDAWQLIQAQILREGLPPAPLTTDELRAKYAAPRFGGARGWRPEPTTGHPARNPQESECPK